MLQKRGTVLEIDDDELFFNPIFLCFEYDRTIAKNFMY